VPPSYAVCALTEVDLVEIGFKNLLFSRHGFHFVGQASSSRIFRSYDRSDDRNSDRANCCVIAGDFDKRIIQAMSMVTADSMEFGVVSTKGIEAFDKATVFTAYVGTKGKFRGEEVSGGDFLFSRSLDENVAPIAESASRKPLNALERNPCLRSTWAKLYSTMKAGVSSFP
jgi:hypothetical protein